MFEHSSPGVYTAEYDRANQVNVVTGGAVTTCVPLPRGLVGKNMSLYGTADVEKYVGPAVGPYKDFVNYLTLLAGKARVVNVTRVAIGSKIAGAYVCSFNNFCTTRVMDFDLDQNSVVPFQDKDIMLVYALSDGVWGNDVYFTIEPDLKDVEGVRFILKVYVGDDRTFKERHVCTSFYKVDDEGNQLFVEDVINEQSKYLNVKFNANHYKLVNDAQYQVVNAICGGPYDPNAPTLPSGQLTGGSDGQAIDINHSDAAIRDSSLAAIVSAWDNYRDWERIYTGVLCDFGLADPVIAQTIDALAQRRMDSIAVSNIPVSCQERDRAVEYRRGLRKYNGSFFNIVSSWSALYASDVKVRDVKNARWMWVPASVAAAYSMMTTDQIAQWLAPAGLNRGMLPFAVDVRHTYQLPDRDVLADNQINAIAVFAGEGIVIWGADTTYGVKSPLNDVHVRRLMSMLHAIVRINNLPGVFEPNDDILRSSQKDSLDRILAPIKKGRGLEWYAIVCDETNNPPEVEDNGDLILDVFMDVTRYTKRIHINATVPRVGQIEFALSLIDKS